MLLMALISDTYYRAGAITWDKMFACGDHKRRVLLPQFFVKS